jgi:hypothetical protein
VAEAVLFTGILLFMIQKRSNAEVELEAPNEAESTEVAEP